ncbi:MAG: TAT-variant-translocated molybdopterin oxidoreductase [Caldilineaceae bacterium]
MNNRNEFWRTLEERLQTVEFQELLKRELPDHLFSSHTHATGAPTTGMGTDRRTFLKLMGATLVMAGLAGCQTEPPRETIVPYVVAPEEIIPGKPLFFASAMPLGGYGVGVLVENHMGRPTKVEGNPQHPASLGGSNLFMQGSVLTLYDPGRAQVITHQGQIETWGTFLDVLGAKLATLRPNNGAGLRILTETVTSPTLGAQLSQLLQQFPEARWHQYEPVGLDNIRAGAQLAFGQVVNPIYHFENAERILTLDGDFLTDLPGSLRYARAFGEKRKVTAAASPDAAQMNRLYALASTPTITGAKADHRLPLRAGQIVTYANVLARRLGVALPGPEPELPQAHTDWLAALARDLQAQPGRSLIIAGPEQPPQVHALAHAMNATLQNVGSTVTYTDSVEVNPVDQLASLRTLVDAMQAGQVDTLIILEANPVLTAPVDFAFADALAQVDLAVHLSLYYDETSALCQWQIPATHYLESWSDVRAYDGTASIIQPLIAPLFDGKSPHELLAALLGNSALTSPYEIVHSTWLDYYAHLTNPPQADFESFLRTALQAGVVAGSAQPAIEVTLQSNWTTALTPPVAPAAPSGQLPEQLPEQLEVIFRPDPSIGDGRFANSAWMQELPKQISTLTWDNAVLLSPSTAARLGLRGEDVVELSLGGHTVTGAVWPMPAHADDAVTLHLGYGRTWQDKLSTGLGFNAYALRTAATRFFGPGLTLRKTGATYPLATTQNHFLMEGRDLVRAATLAEYHADPEKVAEKSSPEPPSVESPTITNPGEPATLYPGYIYDGYAWGMTVDLTACIGCNACTIACQVENNIPTVGKEGVLNGREMHWLKVDHYYRGPLENPESYFQPRPCMHCETAPCELVCPVEATLHNSEGLNQMVYNRCVGTRYCSNNCPYKVRRFNFFDYVEADEIPLLQMWRNPDVTVRARGVMEKCTYCIQRINAAHIQAEEEDRPIRDGEIKTACQTACPTRAIAFGNINDPESEVTRLKALPLNYGLLAELGTRPRTTYLAALRNPNPEIEALAI